MITIVAAAAVATLAQTDTTVPVRSGARLEVNNFGGSIAVTTWAKSAVRVQAEHSSRDRVQVSGSEAVVSVKSTGKYGPSQVIDYTITVPAAMALALSGVYTDITVEGSQGEITAETEQGEVKVTGGWGFLSGSARTRTVAPDKSRGRVPHYSALRGENTGESGERAAGARVLQRRHQAVPPRAAQEGGTMMRRSLVLAVAAMFAASPSSRRATFTGKARSRPAKRSRSRA